MVTEEAQRGHMTKLLIMGREGGREFFLLHKCPCKTEYLILKSNTVSVVNSH